MGFLNEQSLRMIVEAPRNMYDITFFSFPGVPCPTMSMPIKTIKNVANQNNLSSTNDEMAIISGVVVTSFFVIILLILVFVLTLVVKRRRKSASMNATDPIEMSTQPRMLHNTNSKSIVGSNQTYITREEDKHVDCIEMDANHQAYGTNTVQTDPNVVYGTHQPQINDYDYVALP
jgi:flagellar biosynthesis/type III secretory pathway M-ring protein FliF/YscJ